VCDSYEVIQVMCLMNRWNVLISFSSYEAFFAHEEKNKRIS